MEKKCVNCETMNICWMYRQLEKMAHLLNANMNTSLDEKSGFVNMADIMAHDCKWFKAIE